MTDEMELLSHLGLEWNDPRIQKAISKYGPADSGQDLQIARKWLEFKHAGLSMMFKTDPIPLDTVSSQESDRLIAIHLYDGGRAGYSRFAGTLEGGVYFGSPLEMVLAIAGPKVERGGGISSTVLKGKIVPRWLSWSHGGTRTHYQFDQGGKLELVTLMVS